MLVTCPECGKKGISDQANPCPNCGMPNAGVSSKEHCESLAKLLRQSDSYYDVYHDCSKSPSAAYPSVSPVGKLVRVEVKKSNNAYAVWAVVRCSACSKEVEQHGLSLRVAPSPAPKHPNTEWETRNLHLHSATRRRGGRRYPDTGDGR